jgi:DNA-binding response OmpR family regulator
LITRIERENLKILIIDDDPAVREVISLAFELRWPDANVLLAESGESGLLMMEVENPQLMILDIGLPGIDGYDVLSATRSVSDLPIIMLTARDEESSATRALDMGADDYLTKPFSHLILLARAQALLRRSLTRLERSAVLSGA